MKIQLIAYDYALNPNNKMDIIVDVVNASTSDLILFPGHSMRDMNDLFYAEQDITNKHSLAILELEESAPSSCMYMRNSLFMLHGGLFFDLYTSQVFDTEADLEGNDALMDKFLDETKRRQFACCGNRITVLQGGETAMLAGRGLNLDFRFKDNAVLNRRYQNLMAGTDIFLNPIGERMAIGERTDNQAATLQRFAALSSDGRWCIATGVLGPEQSGNFSYRQLQLVYHDGREVSVRPDVHHEEGYVSRILEIPDRVAPWPSSTPS